MRAEDFSDQDTFYRMGTPPAMVDVMSKISGVEFEMAWKRRVEAAIDDNLPVFVISRQDLVEAKTAAGRPQDLIDLDSLRKAAAMEESPDGKVREGRFDAIAEMDAAAARGREEWLRLRSRSLTGKPEGERHSDRGLESTKSTGNTIDKD